MRGVTYYFNVDAPDHLFHLSTNEVGGDLTEEILDGVTNGEVDSGILTFTPDASLPSLIYYQCGLHPYMGYKINLIDGFDAPFVSDLGPGTYSMVVTDANNCTNIGSSTITEPDPLYVNFAVTNSCLGLNNGTAAANILGGSGNNSYTWDTHNPSGTSFSVSEEVKNNTHPYYGIGFNLGFVIDSIQGKELTLVRGIVYVFNINTPSRPFFITTNATGGNFNGEITQGVYNSRTDSGILFFAPNANHPSTLYYQCGNQPNMGFKINIVNPNNNPSVSGLSPGMVSVIISDGNGCSSFSTTIIGENIVSPNISGDTLLCAGDTLHLYSGGGVSYQWNGPNGFTSTDQNPQITNTSPFNSGIYTVTVSDNIGCSANATTVSVVNPRIVYYADQDLDGYGVTANSVQLCEPTGIYTATIGGDCNDTNNVINPAALEICNNGIDDNCDGQIDEGCTVTLNLKLFLEAFYIGGGVMRAAYDPILFPEFCDFVTVELHSDMPDYDTLYSLTNAVDIYGNGEFIFPGDIRSHSYYIAVHHRNCTETWSKNPVLFNGPIVNYDFTTQ